MPLGSVGVGLRMLVTAVSFEQAKVKFVGTFVLG